MSMFRVSRSITHSLRYQHIMPVLHTRLHSGFSLDSSGIAGFFGGEEAFAAMSSVHLVRARRWLGWYNSPGSYFVAKKYGILPNSTFWDSLFPGPSTDPTELLQLDDKTGLRFSGAYNGTEFSTTGHLSNLISRYCAMQPAHEPPWSNGRKVAEKDEKIMRWGDPDSADKRNRNIHVTVVKFQDHDSIKWEGYPKIPEDYFTPISKKGTLFIFLTIVFSLAAGILSALYGDWYSCSMIIFGAFSNGMTSFVLGTGELILEMSEPFIDATPGDGVLYDRKNIIIFQGSEHIIDSILQSRFRLVYPNDPKYNRIGTCAFFLMAQFLLQLFLIPQGALIGQVLFLASLAMSWMCNSYLASFDREKMQIDLLFKLIGPPRIYRMTFEKWSVAAAFTVFYFPDLQGPEGLLDQLMTNNTPSWNLWKKCIAAAVKHNRKPSSFLHPEHHGATRTNANPSPTDFTQDYDDLGSDMDRRFIRLFLRKADEAFDSIRDFEKKAKFIEATSGKTNNSGRIASGGDRFQTNSILPQ